MPRIAYGYKHAWEIYQAYDADCFHHGAIGLCTFAVELGDDIVRLPEDLRKIPESVSYQEPYQIDFVL